MFSLSKLQRAQQNTTHTQKTHARSLTLSGTCHEHWTAIRDGRAGEYGPKLKSIKTPAPSHGSSSLCVVLPSEPRGHQKFNRFPSLCARSSIKLRCCTETSSPKSINTRRQRPVQRQYSEATCAKKQQRQQQHRCSLPLMRCQRLLQCTSANFCRCSSWCVAPSNSNMTCSRVCMCVPSVSMFG